MDHRARLALQESRALSFTSTDRDRDYILPHFTHSDREDDEETQKISGFKPEARGTRCA